ncbi:MAG: hypothetical protein IKL42_05745 [Clostridia bacterium]|nr:hypothetical protein [Clostridia bacterium]
MKKVLSLILALCLVLSMGAFAADGEPVNVYVGGKYVESDVIAKIVNGRTMLPLRAVFEALGAKVSYEEATETVTAEKGNTVVKLVIGSDIMTINGKEKKLDVAAYTENGRTMVPVRACAEAFELKVDWFDEANTVRIRKEVSVILETQDADGNTRNYTYDENGNLILKKSSDGTWEKYTYDKNEYLVYTENSEGIWEKYTYDEFGEKIYTEYYTGGWEKISYDTETNTILQEFPGGWRKVVRDERNNVILSEDSYGHWTKHTYDERNNLVYEEASGGHWRKYTYDENNNLIYIEGNNDYWERNEYDENGNLIMYETGGGICDKYFYD